MKIARQNPTREFHPARRRHLGVVVWIRLKVKVFPDSVTDCLLRAWLNIHGLGPAHSRYRLDRIVLEQPSPSPSPTPYHSLTNMGDTNSSAFNPTDFKAFRMDYLNSSKGSRSNTPGKGAPSTGWLELSPRTTSGRQAGNVASSMATFEISGVWRRIASGNRS